MKNNIVGLYKNENGFIDKILTKLINIYNSELKKGDMLYDSNTFMKKHLAIPGFIGEYLNLRGLIIIYFFLNFEENRFNLNDELIINDIQKLFEIIDNINNLSNLDNGFISFENILLEKEYISIISSFLEKSDKNEAINYIFDFIINNPNFKILNKEFRNILTNFISTIRLNPSSCLLKNTLEELIKKSLYNLELFIKTNKCKKTIEKTKGKIIKSTKN